jgi:hypothetical protein
LAGREGKAPYRNASVPVNLVVAREAWLLERETHRTATLSPIAESNVRGMKERYEA